MKVLTLDEERKVLEKLKDAKLLDNGAARMVFDMPADLAMELGVNAYSVVKVAMGMGGYRQNQLEIETFINNEDSGVLAEIYAHGRFTEIMEKVEAEDWRDLAEEGYGPSTYIDCEMYKEDNETDEHFQERCDEMYDTVEKVNAVISYLDDLFGTTSDNGQLGRTQDGHYVAYDYGFTTDSDCSSQTSDIDGYIYDKEARAKYLSGLISIIDADIELLEHYEKVFLYDENGDGTYTRYIGVCIRKTAEEYMRRWNEKPYYMFDVKYEDKDACKDYIKETDNAIVAYKIIKRIYNLEHEQVGEDEVCETNIPADYEELWGMLYRENYMDN